ncbi:MAG: DUF2905 domain-containing protein [Anaerolineae bacterium]|nr:DUF2905 domain-containing protein [Anaerolineae bacterium]
MPVEQLGRLLMGVGLLLVIVGALVWTASKVPFIKHLGNLPGDIRIQSRDGKYTFYAPVVTSILVSVLLTVIINILVRLFRK